jgi:hypothetical protein
VGCFCIFLLFLASEAFLFPKPWEWQRPPPPGTRPRFRQVQTFSGDVKTVRDDENPYLDGRVLKNQYGRVDGTGYVPDMGPESASTIRDAPSRRRYDYGVPPRGGPPMYQQPQGPPIMYQQSQGPPVYQQQQPSSYYPPPPPPRSSRQDRRRDYDMRASSRDVDPRYVGDEFRREMQKYRRDDINRYDEPKDFYFDKGRNRQGPLETLAKEAEKVIKSVTNIGGPYSQDMGYLRQAASERDMMYPPPPLGPPPLDMRYNNNNNDYYPEGRRSRNSDLRDGNVAGSFDSLRAVRSFEQPRPPRSGYYPGPRPPYQSRRPQYDGGSRYSDDNYENPAARSEQGRLW